MKILCFTRFGGWGLFGGLLITCFSCSAKASCGEFWSCFHPAHSTQNIFSEWHVEPLAGYQMETHTRPSKHLLELSMAEAEIMTVEWRGYLCLPLRIASIFEKKNLYRFGQRKRKALSAPTQRNTLRDQNPKGQLWLWAALCSGVLSVNTALVPSDSCETSNDTNLCTF